jgi:hypothetical protein
VDVGNGGTIGDPCRLATLTAYQLSSSSALINAGLNLQVEFGIDPGTHDYYETSIPIGDQYDIGAHEYRHAADFNGDGVINFLDYAELASAWGTSSGEAGFDDIYDLSDNDIIDITDLGAFSDDWLRGL